MQWFKSGPGDMHSRTLDRVQQVLEQAGVMFVGADVQSGLGVRLKARQPSIRLSGALFGPAEATNL